MNILALNWNDLKNPFGGGAEVHFEELLRRLVRFGHHVTLLCSGWPGCAPEETVYGVRITRRGQRQTFNLVAPYHLRKLVSENQFDILIEDINKIPFYTPLYLRMKTLVVIPHLFASTVFQEINFVVGTYIYLAEKPLVSVYRGKHFNVISESTANDLRARGVPDNRLSVIHCGVDRDIYSPDQSLSRYDSPTILYLGRIKKYKSIQHLLVAFHAIRKKIPNARLMIVGDGDFLPQLRKLSASLGLDDAVEFPGFVSREDKVTRLRRAHVAVLPSLKEGWGLTNIEANAVGTTVIAADSPGLRDSVRHDETGLLYEYGNTEQLAERLLMILQDDKLRHRLEQGGLAWADRFSWDSAAVEFEKLLQKVIKEQ